METLENKFPDVEISDFEITSDGKSSDDFKEAYNIEYNFDNVGDNIYLNPFFVKFFNENPFKLQERTYPIDFGYKDSYFYNFKIQLNDNFAEVSEVAAFIAAERAALREELVNYLTVSLKVDKDANMGIVGDVKQELRKVNALKINYTTGTGDALSNMTK